MWKILYVAAVIFLFSNLKFIYSQPSTDNIDRATREVNRSFRSEAEQELEPVERKPAIIEFAQLDLSKVPDGVYVGENLDYESSYIKLKVTVKRKEIQDIEVVEPRDNDYMKKARAVIDNIITEQSLEAGAIKGDPEISKAIVGAVKNALGIKEGGVEDET